ncbi:hypothetical protein SF12_13285, partial [Streptomyces sp. MBRL 601]
MGEVEVGGGLVEQEQVGLLGERHGDPDALPLAAGEGVHGPVGEVGGGGAGHRSVTARSSSSDHCCHHRWCGWRPRATRSATVIASGATGVCGSSPIRRAICRVGSRASSVPSS